MVLTDSNTTHRCTVCREFDVSLNTGRKVCDDCLVVCDKCGDTGQHPETTVDVSGETHCYFCWQESEDPRGWAEVRA